MLQSTTAQGEALDKDIRGAVYSIVARTGQQADYNAIKQLYLKVIALSLLQ